MFQRPVPPSAYYGAVLSAESEARVASTDRCMTASTSIFMYLPIPGSSWRLAALLKGTSAVHAEGGQGVPSLAPPTCLHPCILVSLTFKATAAHLVQSVLTAPSGCTYHGSRGARAPGQTSLQKSLTATPFWPITVCVRSTHRHDCTLAQYVRCVQGLDCLEMKASRLRLWEC